MAEEKISTFISTFDFSTFSTESMIQNQREIIKNKMLDCINKLKIEATIMSGGLRHSVNLKNKTGIYEN